MHNKLINISILSLILTLVYCQNNKNQIDFRFTQYSDDTESIIKLSEIINSKAKLSKSDCFLIYKTRGSNFNSVGNLQSAIADYNKAIEFSKDSSEIYQIKGLIAFAKTEYNQSCNLYSSSLSFDSNNVITYLYRAVSYSITNQYEKVIQDCKKAISLLHFTKVHFSKTPYTLYAKALTMCKKYKEADSIYSILISADNNNPEWYTARGAQKYFQTNYLGAIADYDTSLFLNPKYPLALCYRANSLFYLKKYDSALININLYLKSIADSLYFPKGIEALFYKSKILFELKDIANSYNTIKQIDSLKASGKLSKDDTPIGIDSLYQDIDYFKKKLQKHIANKTL
jgi:hypothetical protein